ncbi:hypothetical protein WAE61_01710 [Comamonadaceae bacterium PP-2]
MATNRCAAAMLLLGAMAAGPVWAGQACAIEDAVTYQSLPRDSLPAESPLRLVRGEIYRTGHPVDGWVLVQADHAAGWARAALLVSPCPTATAAPAARVRPATAPSRAVPDGSLARRPSETTGRQSLDADAPQAPRVASAAEPQPGRPGRQARAATQAGQAAPASAAPPADAGCACAAGQVCTGPRGGRYCIGPTGKKRYGQ